MILYLVDTNVISEARKASKANPGVRAFFERSVDEKVGLFLSVITVGELRRGVELIRRRGDHQQAALLEQWLDGILAAYAGSGDTHHFGYRATLGTVADPAPAKCPGQANRRDGTN